MTDKNKLELVKIEWEDSTQPVPCWIELEDPPELVLCICTSVGWIAGEDEKVIMLAPNIADLEDGIPYQASGYIRIPKCAITRTVALQEFKARKTQKRRVMPAFKDAKPGFREAVKKTLRNPKTLKAAEKMLRNNPNSSKKAKTARGSALTQKS